MYRKIETQEDYDAECERAETSNKYLRVSNSIIDGDIVFHGVLNEINVHKCRFNGNVSFDRSLSPSIIFTNCKFNYINFENSEFLNKFRMHDCTIEGAMDFNNALFKDLCDFYSCTFKCKLILYKTDFNGTLVFSATTFHENVLFTYTLIEKLIILQRVRFLKGLDVSLMILDGRIKAFSLEIEDFESTKNPMDDSIYHEHISRNAIITHDNKRETFRILKNEMLSQNDSITAVKFRKLESNTYRIKVIEGTFIEKALGVFKSNTLIKRFFSFLDSIGEFIMIYLNYLSNNFRASWLRGVLFTILVSIAIFNIMLSFTHDYKLGLSISESLSIYSKEAYNFSVFINPIHKTLEYENLASRIEGDKLPWFYTWDYLGRVLISYGIYQTVQAFRKYK